VLLLYSIKLRPKKVISEMVDSELGFLANRRVLYRAFCLFEFVFLIDRIGSDKGKVCEQTLFPIQVLKIIGSYPLSWQARRTQI